MTIVEIFYIMFWLHECKHILIEDMAPCRGDEA